MQFDFSRWGPLTVLIVALVAIFATAGAILVIVHPDTLSFDQLLGDVSKFVIGLGALGIGHGIHSIANPTDQGDVDSVAHIPVANSAPPDGNDAVHGSEG